MRRSVQRVFRVTIALGILAAVGAAWLASRHGLPNWLVFAGVVIAGLIGELATINGDHEEGEQAFSFATTAHLTGAILLLPGWAALAAGLGSAFGEIGRRARPIHVALNASPPRSARSREAPPSTGYIPMAISAHMRISRSSPCSRCSSR